MKPNPMQELGEALPGLQAAREAGRLVPFVGAGLSRPHCRAWPQFIEALYDGFGVTAAERIADVNPENLYRVADRVAAWLRLLPDEERQRRLREALHDPASPNLPAQAVALASFAWPLVITTNYDDVVPLSFRQCQTETPRLLGRSAQDCIQVVRSLDALDTPIAWYIQGYLGAPADSAAQRSASRSLLDEVVVGHQQYQQAINSSQSFRRAFSEVFRRRSLVFVGSGLAESYFVNLIAETLLSLGPSIHPHFALFSEQELERVDADFLSVRLGITPVCYGADYADLPAALERLAAVSVPGRQGGARADAPRMSGANFDIPRVGGGTAPAELSVALRLGRIASPGPSACVVLSVGRDRQDGRFVPGIGQQAWSFLREYEAGGVLNVRTYEDVPGLAQGRMFRVHHGGEPAPIFLLAAREMNEQPDDEARSLAALTEATAEALGAVERAGFAQVSMGLMAAGPNRRDAAPYCLVAQLSGVRDFATVPPEGTVGLLSVSIDVLDKEAWSALMQGRIPVIDLLTSRLARVLVRVADREGRVEEFALSVPHSATVGDVLASYRIQEEGIQVSVRPLPRQTTNAIRAVRVFPGMVVEVTPAVR
ncbi:SIR2 family protein [Roseomonas sp. KE2513]|uniref:SIR2 family protein n=1 Tax=Roseomonas sp. KE2513 TaxID=2479202 RepID=UPI0018E04D81|nr:SIR2 family protein [Roseomonas sp. KE2513]MBI0537735.1 SIR2 family protein [Roseomonas sp. KE2513]